MEEGTTVTKTFSYTNWLKSIKEGQFVKVQGHKQTVVGITEDTIIIQFKENVGHFDRSNGRELANKSGCYKDKTLTPYTKEDEALEAKKEAEKKESETKLAIAKEIVNLAIGPGSCGYSSNLVAFNSLKDLEAMKKFLEKLRAKGV